MISNRTKITSVSLLAYLFLSVVSVSSAADEGRAGQADIVFDRDFLQSVRNVKLYERIVKIVGVPAVKVAESSVKIPGEKYHWNGRENSSFNIRINAGKVIDANVVTTEGRILELGSDGELIEFGK